MKSQSKGSLVSSFRCSYRTATGRQCRQLSADSQSCLCPHHLDEQKLRETGDLSGDLLARSQNFQTAQGINFALGNVYRLLASNRISPRRAAVLAFINSLQLRTLPAIDADNEAGITDPTAPKPQPAPDPEEEATLDLTAESEQESEASEAEPSEAEPKSNAKSGTPETNSNSPEANAKPTAAPPKASTAPSPIEPSAAEESAPPSKYRSYWDTIASPTKKPS